MADLHWFPMYSEKWLGSAAINQMLPEQEGAYCRLLNVMWLAAGDGEPHLPTDDDALAQMSRLGKRWKKLGPLIRAQFNERDGLLYNTRLSEVWREQQLRHAKAVERGRRGGKAKNNSRTSREQAVRVSSPSTVQAKHSSIALVTREVKDSLTGGAGAVPDGGPAPTPSVEKVRQPGGLTKLAGILQTFTQLKQA